MGTLQSELNRLAGITNMDAQGAANVWAGTTGLDLVGALNAKAGTTGLELQGVVNALAGTFGVGVDGALGSVTDEPTATQVVTDTFAYATGDLPAPWVQTPVGVWKVDGPTQVAYANLIAGNAVQDTTSRDHRALINLKTGGATDSISGAILRYKDELNYISFEYVWTSTESAWSLFIKAGGVGREIKFNASPALAADQDHTIQVDAFGEEITVTLDGATWEASPYALTGAESTALDGTATKAGMTSFSGAGNFYDVTLYTLAA